MEKPSAAKREEIRQAARRKLNQLTVGIVAGALGGVGVFGAVSAATIPGVSASNVSGSTASTAGSTVATGFGSAPAVSSSSGTAVAVSGGSR